MTDPNSAEYWQPLAAEVTAFTPKTIFVPYDHRAVVEAIEDGEAYPAWEGLVEQVWEAVQEVGPPAFVRTDQASAKHDGPNAYKISRKTDVPRVLSTTVEDNEMKFWPVGPTPKSFLVREWLDLNASFTAFDGHRVAREWRFFATADEVLCRHFYWPHEAIFNASDDDWSYLLDKLAEDPPPSDLDAIVVQAAQRCSEGEAWSIDFAESNGDWWLIDMALAEQSWHPDHA